MSATKTIQTDDKKSDPKNAPAATAENRNNPRPEQVSRDAVAERAAEPVNRDAAAERAAAPRMTIDDSALHASYANLCRVSSTPEELILDLGLNPNPYARTDHTVQLSQRIIMNHFTAKRLLAALSVTLQRHEQAFGVLEVDVTKRVRNT